MAPIRPGQVVLPTDRVKDPDATKTLLFGEDYQERPVVPPAAPSADGANPQAATKEPGYAF